MVNQNEKNSKLKINNHTLLWSQEPWDISIWLVTDTQRRAKQNIYEVL